MQFEFISFCCKLPIPVSKTQVLCYTFRLTTEKGGSIIKERAAYIENWRFIAAIVPYYDENNETACEVHYITGLVRRYPCRCEVILSRLARAFRTSLETAQSRAAIALDVESLRKPPLVFWKRFCLIQLKYRTVLRHNDKTICYVVRNHVKEVQETPDGSIIHFWQTGYALPVLQKRRSILEQLQKADDIYQKYEEELEFWDAHNRFADIVMENLDEIRPEVSPENSL